MDVRLLVVLAPVLLAAAWAVTRVLPFVIRQFQDLLKKNADMNI